MRPSPAPLSVVGPAGAAPSARPADGPAPRESGAPAPQVPLARPQVSWPAPAGAGGAGRELAERLARFHAAHPAGRVVTELMTRSRDVAVFRAAVYRGPHDREPAATGWATSGAGVGPAFERAEETAVGRALAHLGFAPGATALPAGLTVGPTAAPDGAPGVWPPDPARAALVADLDALVARAERYGLRPRRAAAWRARLRAGALAAAELPRAEQRLRAWVERRRGEPYAGAF